LPTRFRYALSALVLANAALPVCSAAQDLAAPPLWEIGAVGVAISQQAYPGAVERVNKGIALPFLVYRGEYFRVDRGSAGIRTLKTDAVEVDVGVAGSLGAKSDAIEARRGMPNLGMLAEFGPRLRWNLGAGPGQGNWRAEFPVRGVFDLNNGLAHKGTAFEPELIFERRGQGDWNYSTGLGAVWGDRQLAETFYGVAPVYATPARFAYRAEGGLFAWRLSASLSRKLTPNLRLFGFARADLLSGSANGSSPLVERKTGTSLGLVLAYTWKQSERRAVE
jgi:outer membrane scaffolding protein for murein synthesis (MipA/OmpV family)